MYSIKRDLFNRYDYFLIWGHGLAYLDEIIEMINRSDEFDIVKIVFYSPTNMKRFVKEVYKFDYAPFQHLKNKTKYLMEVPAKVTFIFVRNRNPLEIVRGNGEYRHVESSTIKNMKEKIRDIYNPKVDGKRTEQHIIHASDNEIQTDRILKYLGINEGINVFDRKVFGMPTYINDVSKKYIVANRDLNEMYCRTVTGKGTTKIVKLTDSPQYLGITGCRRVYDDYLKEYLGIELLDFYSYEKLMHIKESITINSYIESGNYILFHKYSGKDIVLDGLHRASALLSKGFNYVPVVEIVEE